MDTTKTLFDTSSFWTINWYYIVVLIVSITGIIIAYKNYRKKPAVNTDKIGLSNNSTATSNPTITITNNLNSPKSQEDNSSNITNSISEEKLKATTKILFVDDNHTEYRMVSILKKAGWAKTKSVKDITDLDAQIGWDYLPGSP